MNFYIFIIILHINIVLCIYIAKTLKEKSQFYPNFDFHFATIPKGNEIINPPNRFSYVEKEEFKKLRKLSSLSSILGNAIEIEFSDK